MKQTFFRNLIFLLVLNVLIKPLYVLGVDRTVQNLTGHGDYGLYFALFNLSILFSIILDIGITNYNNRIIAQQPSLIKKYLSNILCFKVLLFILYCLLTFAAAIFLQPTKEGYYILGILILNQGLNSLLLYLRSNLSALQFFKLDSFLSILDKLLMILLFGWLYYFKPIASEFQIEWFVYSQTASYVITILVASVLLLQRIPKLQFSFEFSMLKTIWKESYLLAIIVLLMGIYTRIDAVLLKKLLGTEGDIQAGIYASAFRLLDAANQFGFLFAALLLPIFSRLIRRGQKVDELTAVSFKTIFIFSWMLAVVCLFFRNEIMQLLYHDTTIYSANILGILMFALPGASTVYIFGTLLAANRSLKELAVATALTAIINFSLNIILIPKYQCTGAAIAAVSTQCIIGVIEIFICRKIFQLKMNLELISKLILFSLLSLAVGYSAHTFITSLIPGVIAGLGVSLLIAFGLKLFELKKVRSMLISGEE